MSNRKSAFQSKTPNPCQNWIQWESDHKCLSFFDKTKEEKEKKIKVPLPFKFLALDGLITVSGYNKKRDCGIYSNEVKDLEGIITAKYFDNNDVIASGTWNAIKKDIVSAGGHFTHSIYIMTAKGHLANIKLKGTALSAWIEFTKKTRSRLHDEWITITSAKEAGDDRNKYSFPVFEFTGSLDKESAAIADDHFNVVELYMSQYLKAPVGSNDPVSQNRTDGETEIIASGEKEVNTEDAAAWDQLNEGSESLPF